MPKDKHEADGAYVARIPADVERADRVLGPCTARQCAQLAVIGLLLYCGYFAARTLMAPLAYLAMIIPVAGMAIAVVLGRREGIGLDRYLLAAASFARTPRRRVHAPEGVTPLPGFVPESLAAQARPLPTALELPLKSIAETGAVDLGPDGQAGLAAGTPVNFDLRTPAEQQGLIAAFARWLNALTGPVQLLVSGQQVDLAPVAAQLQADAPGLPHVALENAARAHANFLLTLGNERQLLTRHSLLIAREPLPPAARRGDRSTAAAGAAARVSQRLREAERALAAAEVDLTVLPAHSAAAAIRAVTDPDTPLAPDAHATAASAADGRTGQPPHRSGA